MRVAHPFRFALGVVASLTLALSLPLTVQGSQVISHIPGVSQLSLATFYIVQAGDTLYGIASRNGILAADIPAWVDQVVKLNGLADPDTISVGDTIQLPQGADTPGSAGLPSSSGSTATYTVVAGETLSSIGAAQGVPGEGLSLWIDEVVRLNALDSPDMLTAGQQLKIPSASQGQNPFAAQTLVTVKYTVKSGDTLNAIAESQGIPDDKVTDWIAAVMTLNQLQSADTIVEGQELQLPSARPVPTAPPPAAASPGNAVASVAYTIQPGDTLSSIGQTLGITGYRLNAWVTEVLTLSGIASTDLLREGQVIQIPVSEDNAALVKPAQPPSLPNGTMDYVVQAGDTLSSIGDKLGVTEDALAGWIAQVVDINNLANPNILTIGEHLTVPRPAGAAPAPGGAESATGPDAAISESSCFYTVRAEDSWKSIAATLGIADRNFDAWVALVTTMNGIDAAQLPVGDALRLPC